MKRFFTRLTLIALLAVAALPGKAADPIFSYDFQYTDASQLTEDFTINDNNSDNTKWALCTFPSPYKYVRCYAWTTTDYNDDLITKQSYALQAGHAYKLSFSGSCEDSDLSLGTRLAIGLINPEEEESSIKSIFSNRLDYVNKNNTTPKVYETVFEVDEDGEYKFIFKAIGTDKGGVGLDNIVLIDNGSPMSPQPVTSLLVEAAADFSLKATLNITLPTKTVTGSDLPADGISKVEIYRGETLAGTITTDLTPGGNVTWTDNSASEGINTYSVIVYNGELASSDVEASAYVGPLTPNAPTLVKAAKAEDGKISVSWSAPTGSLENQSLNASLIKYNVKRSINGAAATAVASAISDTEYLDTPPESDEFQTIIYSVEAVYGSRTSESVDANPIKIGTYTLPFDESFANAVLPDDWTITTSDTSTNSPKEWKVGSKMNSSPSATPYDSDGGLLTYNSYNARSDYWSQAITPEINLSGSTAPVLEFYFYHSTSYSSSNDRIVVEVSENGGDFKEIEGSEIKRYDGSTGWKLHQIPLSTYTDADRLQISFKAISGNGADMAIDAIRIYNGKAYDLEAGTLTATTGSVNTGAEAEFAFTVNNVAFADVAGSDYSIKVYEGNELNSTIEGKDVAAGQSVEFTFAVPTHAGHVDAGLPIYAEIVFDKDEDQTNNESQSVSVSVVAYGGQGVTGVKATEENGSLRLTWDDIEVENYEKLESEITLDSDDDILVASKEEFDADQSIAWPETFTGSNDKVWRNIDADGKVIPKRYSTPEGARGFMFASWEITGNSSQKDYSGERTHGMLEASSPAQSDGPASDYLVSPKLPGKGTHVLEFMGKSYSYACTADFTIEYTTDEDFSATDIADKFQPVGEKVHIANNYQEGGKWIQYSYIIPAAAKYVAIHFTGEAKTSYDYSGDASEVASILCIDNIKLVSEPMSKPTYNVYYTEGAVAKPNTEGISLLADESTVKSAPKKHNTEPITTNEYVISKPTLSTSYHVSAVYPQGETAISEPYYYDIESGMELVEGSVLTKVVKVDGRTISVIADGENTGFDLYGINGAILAHGVESYTVASTGVYVVKAGDKVIKIMVR